MDPENTLECCKTLIMLLDDHVSRLERDEANSLTFQSKAKAVMKDSGVRQCIDHLNDQTQALNLLFSVLNRWESFKHNACSVARSTDTIAANHHWNRKYCWKESSRERFSIKLWIIRHHWSYSETMPYSAPNGPQQILKGPHYSVWSLTLILNSRLPGSIRDM